MIKRIFIEPSNIYKDSELYTTIYNLIHNNGDLHITNESAQYYSKPSAIGIGVCYYVQARNKNILVGFSGCSMDPQDYSITVIAKEFRGIGIGNILLKKKIELLPDFHTVVAEDNKASIAACKKAGLIQVGSSKGKRKSGEFTQLHFSKLKIKPKENSTDLELLACLSPQSVSDNDEPNLLRVPILAGVPLEDL